MYINIYIYHYPKVPWYLTYLVWHLHVAHSVPARPLPQHSVQKRNCSRVKYAYHSQIRSEGSFQTPSHSNLDSPPATHVAWPGLSAAGSAARHSTLAPRRFTYSLQAGHRQATQPRPLATKHLLSPQLLIEAELLICTLLCASLALGATRRVAVASTTAVALQPRRAVTCPAPAVPAKNAAVAVALGKPPSPSCPSVPTVAKRLLILSRMGGMSVVSCQLPRLPSKEDSKRIRL